MIPSQFFTFFFFNFIGTRTTLGHGIFSKEVAKLLHLCSMNSKIPLLLFFFFFWYLKIPKNSPCAIIQWWCVPFSILPWRRGRGGGLFLFLLNIGLLSYRTCEKNTSHYFCIWCIRMWGQGMWSFPNYPPPTQEKKKQYSLTWFLWETKFTQIFQKKVYFRHFFIYIIFLMYGFKCM